MLQTIVEEFSTRIFDQFYAHQLPDDVTKEDWSIRLPHKTSALFGFHPHLLGKDLQADENDRALFMLVWNEFDHILYLNMERYNPNDISIFPIIYQELKNYLNEKEIDCLVSVFCYEHYEDIQDMMNSIPLSYTGVHSQKVYEMLEKFPMFKGEIPVLQIGFDGIQYNDWQSKQFQLKVDMKKATLSISDVSGAVISHVKEAKEAEKFIKKYIS